MAHHRQGDRRRGPGTNATDGERNFVIGPGAKLFEKLRRMPMKLGDAADRMAQEIRTIDLSDPEDRARHDRVVGLVERMLDLHERLAEAKIGQEKTVIQHQIDATDRQIDRLVYELHELTGEEVKIVEEATTR